MSSLFDFQELNMPILPVLLRRKRGNAKQAMRLSRSSCMPVLVMLALSLLLNACGSSGKNAATVPTTLKLEIAASADLNPDHLGRAAPILVRIYELRSDEQFQDTDFFSLQQQDKQILGDQLLARDELILLPGERHVLQRQLDPQTRYLAVLAGYRQLHSATWRSVQALAPAPSTAWYRVVLPDRKLAFRLELGSNAIKLSQFQ
jgi:type VI secretion system protein VasD